ARARPGIPEPPKSRTPLIVLAPEATQPRSNFYIALPAIAAAVGAEFRRVGAERVTEDVAAACAAGRTVILGLPLDVQGLPAGGPTEAAPAEPTPSPAPDVGPLVTALAASRRPPFIAGRGATRPAGPAGAALVELADRCGALLAVSAAAKGLFAGNPWDLDVSGGFATPLCAELIGQADLVVAWGSTLNMWTTRH